MADKKTDRTDGTPFDDSTPKHSDKAAQPPDNDTPTKAKADSRTTMPTREEREENQEYRPTHPDKPYPPSWTRTEKMKKETAEYRKGKPFHSCGSCRHYSDRECDVVAGYISPDMGCSYYQEKYSPENFMVMIGKRKG